MIDVIVPVLNRPDYTQFFLESFAKVNHGTDIGLIIVDNGSRKRTKKMFYDWKEENLDVPTTIIEEDVNKGFAGAINIGVATSKSDRIIILHNDTVPFDGWAGEMAACLDDADEEVAVIVPRTNYANEMSMCLEDTRAEFEEIKPSNKGRMMQDEIKEIMDKLYPNPAEFLKTLRENMRTTHCPEISSFCALFNKDLFLEFGGFDEDFWPKTYEDKLWFVQAQREGYVCEIANWAYVHHFGNITSDGPGFFFPEDAAKNEKIFKKKVDELHAQA